MLEREGELFAEPVGRAARWLAGLLAPAPDSGGPGPAAGQDGQDGQERQVGRDGQTAEDAAPAVRWVVDAGSGPGVFSCLLARAFPEAEVVAVDGSPELLERARERARREGLGDRVTARAGELPEVLAEVGDADVVFSSRAVHHLGDQQAVLDRMAGMLRPGGLLAVAEGGLPQRFLPRDFGLGRPGFQARLEAATEEWFAEMRAELPGAREVVEDWPRMLSTAGLVPAGSRTFLLDLPAPLGSTAREYLYDNLAGLRDRIADRLDGQDRETLAALVEGDACTGVLWRPDAFCLAARTVHAARAVAAR
ncbi:class I SAM-dependent methyltransferase [Streptomyces sp. JJ36]|nr:class I SAM-dependent methyltransferase [Streptomyces sp. JJ36]